MEVKYENYGPYRLQVDYKENGVEVIAFPVMNYARESTLGFEVSVDLKDVVSDEFINEYAEFHDARWHTLCHHNADVALQQAQVRR